jgi:hypothetical protein
VFDIKVEVDEDGGAMFWEKNIIVREDEGYQRRGVDPEEFQTQHCLIQRRICISDGQ